MENVGIRRFLENRMNNDFINSSVEHCTSLFNENNEKNELNEHNSFHNPSNFV